MPGRPAQIRRERFRKGRHPIVMRCTGDTPDESSGRDRNRIVRIEIRTAVHPPYPGEDNREAIGHICVRRTHVASDSRRSQDAVAVCFAESQKRAP
jgi:hypothetical protein